MSGISWTDCTWNPVVGCSHVSPGCDHCYAERMAKRLVAMGSYPASVLGLACDEHETVCRPECEGCAFPYGWSGHVATFPDKLEQPLRWRQPRLVFVCSMGDLFHEDVPEEFILQVFNVMAQASQHTFQVLTKRPERMRELLSKLIGHSYCCDSPDGPVFFDEPVPFRVVPPNVWLGVTAENQEQADKRIPILMDTPAAVRFVSCEPLLGPIDLTAYLGGTDGAGTRPGDGSLPSSTDGRVGDRPGGAHMAGGSPPLGSLAQGDPHHPMRAQTGREVSGQVPPGQGHVREAADTRSGSPDGMASLQRSDSPRTHGESRGRGYHKQSTRQSDPGDLRGAADSLSSRPGTHAGTGQSGPFLSWVIAGGETGPGARPMNPVWVRSLRDQCQAAGVPFHFKQWGPNKAAGRLLDGREWQEFPA